MLGAYDAEADGEDPLALKPHRLQFHGEAPPPEALLRETWNDVITRRVFGQDHPPALVPGFFAEEHLYEVKKAGEADDPLKNAWFVPARDLAGSGRS